MLRSLMEFSGQFNIQNIENPHGFDWPYSEEPFLAGPPLFEGFPPLDNFTDCFYEFPPTNRSFSFNHLCHYEFQNLDIQRDDLLLECDIASAFEDDPSEEKQSNKLSSGSKSDYIRLSEVSRMIESRVCREEMERRGSSGRKKSAVLGLDEIEKHFDMPITEAAKELKVGLTVLKKRCRELNIRRWPHRKLKSLKSLIHNVKEMGWTNEIVKLEEHKRLVEKVPGMELTERTRKLRQACFKAKYKMRKLSLRAHN